MRWTRSMVLALALAGCGGSAPRHRVPAHAPTVAVARTGAVSHPAAAAQPPLALVTAETENRLLVVDLRSGRTVRAVPLPPDPENVAAGAAAIVVVSSRAGDVSLLNPRTFRAEHLLRGFDQPHIPAIAPDGRYAYVTDDARGTVSVIRLQDGALTSTVRVGSGAHHMAFSPDGRLLWIALGESGSTIVTLDTSNPVRPRITGRFDAGFRVHDLRFVGNRVWLGSATGPDVEVLDARTGAFEALVHVGPPPQHIALDGASVYLTSGYGGVIERADARTARVLARASTPYGSFELDARDGLVVSSSLLRGTLAVFNLRLEQRHVIHLAPAARDVVIFTGAR